MFLGGTDVGGYEAGKGNPFWALMARLALGVVNPESQIFLQVLVKFAFFFEVSAFALQCSSEGFCCVRGVHLYILKFLFSFLNKFFSLYNNKPLSFVKGGDCQLLIFFLKGQPLFMTRCWIQFWSFSFFQFLGFFLFPFVSLCIMQGSGPAGYDVL